MSEKEYPIDGLLAEIRQAADPARGDRGMLAALRRGLSDDTASYAWPYIAKYCDIADARQRIIWLTVAGAAATLEPRGLVAKNAGNMGATMRDLARGDSGQKLADALSSFEARFRRLLTCQTTEELCRHLVRVIRTAMAKDRKVNVRTLFYDIQDWENREKRDVRVLWAKGYWAGDKREEDA